MNKVIKLIRNHQMASFLLLTLAIKWVLKQPYPFSYGYAPALAGIFITAILNKRPLYKRSMLRWPVFIVALIVSIALPVAALSILNLQQYGIKTPNYLMAASHVGWIIFFIQPAYILSAAWSRIPAMRKYLASLVSLRGVGGWALLALGIFPALAIISMPISIVLGSPARLFPYRELVGSYLHLLAYIFIYLTLFLACVGEEVGWRGFLLPRLQARYSPIVAILFLALFWSTFNNILAPFWSSFPNIGIRYFPSMATQLLTASIGLSYFSLPATAIIVWLYNRSGGSILVATIAHSMFYSAFLIHFDYTFIGALYITAATLLIKDKAWRRLPKNHPAARVKF